MRMIRDWIHLDDLEDALADWWPKRLARNIHMAALFRSEYIRGYQIADVSDDWYAPFDASYGWPE